MKISQAGVCLTMAVLTPWMSLADTITNWLGGASTSYGAPANWSNGVANGAFSATIPGGTPFEPATVAGFNYTVDNLTLSAAGAMLTISDNSSLFINASNGGAINNSGSIAINS